MAVDYKPGDLVEVKDPNYPIAIGRYRMERSLEQQRFAAALATGRALAMQTPPPPPKEWHPGTVTSVAEGSCVITFDGEPPPGSRAFTRAPDIAIRPIESAHTNGADQ